MTERVIQVTSSLEARPAAMFVQAASKFQSSVYVEVGNKKVNGKSIMGIISMGIIDGQSVKLIADGIDEAAALDELEHFFK